MAAFCAPPAASTARSMALAISVPSPAARDHPGKLNLADGDASGRIQNACLPKSMVAYLSFSESCGTKVVT
jgi:hypothetical protein